MTRSILGTLWVLLAGHAFAQIQSGLDYDVYFLAGQSNAAGRGIASELPGISGGIYNAPQTDVAFYYSSTLTNSSGQINTALQEDVFLPLQAGSGHGFNNPSSAPVEFGPELSLGRTLADEYPSRNIAIIKYAHGGSNLHTQWDVNGIRYTHFVETANDALDAITGAGATFNLKGLSWVQGESDANNNSTAYEANLTDFISRVRNDVFAGENAPIVVSRLSANQYNSLSTNITNVRNAQSAVALADPNVFTIDTDGPEFSTYNINTPIHFDAMGNIAQGIAIGQAFVGVEPPAGLLCDLDADGDCDPNDLDLLYQTDSPDIAAWLERAADTSNPWKTDLDRNPGGSELDMYIVGDVNLDGEVDSSDLGLLLNNFGNPDGLPPNGVGWGGGDLDADGNVNSRDLGLVLNNFNFSSANSASVPEPSSSLLCLALAVIGLHCRRRR